MSAVYSDFPAPSRLVRALERPMQLTLHGMSSQERVEHLEHWQGHLSYLHLDTGSARVIGEFLRSSGAHISWRIIFGPPSALLPGAALLLAGIATAMFALAAGANSTANVLMSAASLALGYVLVRHPRIQPRRGLAVATFVAAVTCFYYAMSYARVAVDAPSWFIVAGAALISVGMAIVCLGALPVSLIELQTGRAWGFTLCAFGTGSIAVAELNLLLVGSDPFVLVGRGFAAVAMLAVTFTAWRIREVAQLPEASFAITAAGPASRR